MKKFFKAVFKAFQFGYAWYQAHPEEAKQIDEAVKKASKKILK